MEQSQLHPLDFEVLHKDQNLNQSDVEAIVGFRYDKDPPRYQFELMKLRAQIKAMRNDLPVRISGRGLRIMTDVEADDYNWKEQRMAVVRQIRIAGDRARIDRTEFDDVRKRTAEQRDLFATAQAVSQRKALRAAEREQLMLGAPPAEDEG